MMQKPSTVVEIANYNLLEKGKLIKGYKSNKQYFKLNLNTWLFVWKQYGGGPEINFKKLR